MIQHAIHFIHGIVPIVYLIIAMQFFILLRSVKKQQKAEKGLIALVFIFLLCSICGYVSDIANIWPPLELMLHILLLTASILFVVTQQASSVVAALKDQDQRAR